MSEFDDLLIIGDKDPNLEKKGIHTVDHWNGDHRFHHNKVNLYNLFGQRTKLYGFTKEQIQKHHRFIIHEEGKIHWLIDDIRKWNPNAEIKFVMGNIVSDYGDWKIRDIQKRGVEVFSFDGGDCKKYGLTYHPGLHIYEKNFVDYAGRSIVNDIYFIGKDKGRADYILDLKRNFDKHGITCSFNVVLEKSNYSAGDIDGVHFLKTGIPYAEVLEGVAESKVVLEIVQKGQVGPTMRPFEALFFDKKLLTNNQGVKDLEFYSFGNIMLLDEHTFEEIIDFVRSPMVPYDESIKNEYNLAALLRRFFVHV